MFSFAKIVSSLVILGSVLMISNSTVVAYDGYDYATQKFADRLATVGVDEKLGETISLSTEFTDHSGSTVSLSELMSDGHPVLLTLNYSNCPGLCISQLSGLVRGVNQIPGLKLGSDFHMVSLSIDPRESVERARRTQKRYASELTEAHDKSGWRFWVGSEKDILSVANSVGFRYSYDTVHDQFNHSAVAILISPSGRITRYLYEIGYTGDTLKMALIEAGEGRVGSSVDMIALWCAHYDPLENRYSTSARVLLSIAAGMFVVLGLSALVPFWISFRYYRGTPAPASMVAVSQSATDQLRSDQGNGPVKTGPDAVEVGGAIRHATEPADPSRI